MEPKFRNVDPSKCTIRAGGGDDDDDPCDDLDTGIDEDLYRSPR